MESFQKELIKIRAFRLLTWEQLAHAIGIKRPTLMNFMDYGRKPSFLTLAKISQFIERNQDALKQREIK